MMWRVAGSIAAVVLALNSLGGCARVDRPSTSLLRAPQLGPESVAFELTSVRVPAGDPTANGAIWAQVDEQQVPANVRRLLNDNGFRVGIVGAQLPVELERLLQLTEAPPPETSEGTEVADFETEPVIRRLHMQVLAGRRSNLVCTGEHNRHEELPVLIRGADGQVNGRTYRKVMGLLALRALPLEDGRVRLEFVPEIEHGEARRRFEPSDGALRIEFTPPHEEFDLLKFEAQLAPGQMLLLTAMIDRPGSLGYRFFMEPDGDKSSQKLLLLRLTRTVPGALFLPDAGPSAEANPAAL